MHFFVTFHEISLDKLGHVIATVYHFMSKMRVKRLFDVKMLTQNL
jgi:hypothetical protein